ncbi:MAG: hypothetical protein ABW167_12835 [Baekduia sp.]
MGPSIVTSVRRGLVAIALVMVGALATTSTAQAEPGTEIGKYIHFSVDDTTPIAGQTITFDWIYNRSSNDDNGVSARLGFGTWPERDVDVSDLVPVPGSCGGVMSNCTMVSHPQFDFVGDVPVGSDGDFLTGTAKFKIAPDAPAGETFGLIAWHEITKPGLQPSYTSTLHILDVVVAPSADLSVSLDARAPLLGSWVVYKATATNNGPEATSSATVSTQLSARALSLAPGSPCTFLSAAHQVSCPVEPMASGASRQITFAVNYSLFGSGSLPATATRIASSPVDPNATNDADTANCTGAIPLFITC